jgi:hypothetical protein
MFSDKHPDTPEKEVRMFFNHKGDTVLEWVIIAVLVVSLVGTTIFVIATSAKNSYGNLNNALNR